MSEEFIDRERQLPADSRQAPIGVTSNAALSALAKTPQGEPPMDYTVRSVYDSRPVQGYDFNIVETTAEAASTNNLGFVVPEGYVAVIRAVRVILSPPVAVNLDDVLLTLQVNGADVPYNTNLPVGDQGDIVANYFEIADQNNPVNAKIVISSISGTHALYAWFYGNFLLKTGVPANFQIANRAGEGIIGDIRRTTAPAPIIQPQMSAPSFAPSPVPAPQAPVVRQPITPPAQTTFPPPGWASMSPADRERWYRSHGYGAMTARRT